MKKGVAISLMLLAILSLVPGCSSPSTFSPATPITITPTTPTQQIIITYSATTTTHLGLATQPSPGYIYLVLDMTIENQGYDSFNMNTIYFGVLINGHRYGIAIVYELDDELKPANIPNGGTAQGKLAFEIPQAASTSDFQVVYSSLTPHYNIEWVEE